MKITLVVVQWSLFLLIHTTAGCAPACISDASVGNQDNSGARQHSFRSSHDHPDTCGVDDDVGDGTLPEQKSSTVVATFKAQKVFRTHPFQMPPPGKTLDDFFGSTDHRNLLFSSRAVVQEAHNITKGQMKRFWVDSGVARESIGMEKCDDKAITRIVSLINPSMQFFGIRLVSIVLVGTQLLLGRKEGGSLNQIRLYPGFPEFQFTLMGSSFKAEGPKPVVWLFNKITNRGKPVERVSGGVGDYDASDGENDSEAIRTSGFTRIWAEPADNGMVVFCTDARLQSELEIPRIMMRLLPLSLEKLQKQGSRTLQNAVDKDVIPGMKRFGEAYESWLSS